MLKALFYAAILASVPAAAVAQQAGSTYPQGSNPAQRTAGEVAPKLGGSMSGSGGPTSNKVQSKADSKKGAKPQHKKRRTPH